MNGTAETSIRPMTIGDHQSVTELWDATDGIFLADADDSEGLRRYLTRNPTTSFVATRDDQIVGAILCGHDGRRASMHHLAVATSYRHQGIGRLLVESCVAALDHEGISSSYIFVLNSNTDAIEFWARMGWDVQTNFAAFKKRDCPSV